MNRYFRIVIFEYLSFQKMNSANKAFLNVSMFIVSLDNVAGTVGLMLLIRQLCFTGPRAVR